MNNMKLRRFTEQLSSSNNILLGHLVRIHIYLNFMHPKNQITHKHIVEPETYQHFKEIRYFKHILLTH